MTPEQVSQQAIEEAAAFAFQGAPRAYMETEFELGDNSIFERWIYVVYSYGWRGPIPVSGHPLAQLTTDIVKGIHSLDAGRVAVVWRRYPERSHDADTDTHYASVRLAEVDESLCQVNLELPSLKKEGEPPMMLT